MSVLGRMKSAWGALFGGGGGFVPSGGGVIANPVLSSGADERWLHIAAYFACIRNIAEDVAKLPLLTYRRLERGKERAPEHPLYRMLAVEPHPALSAMSLRETLTRYALGWGNGYAKILRLGSGEAYGLEPVHPQYVLPESAAEGHVQYRVNVPGRPLATIADRDMIHVHGLSSDGVNGLSVAGLARETLEFAGSAQRYGYNLFTNGGRPAGVLEFDKSLSKDQKANLSESWDTAFGGANAGGKTAILDNNAKYKPISINPVDAQYFETRQFSVEEVARWFRMPLHKIQYLVRAQGWSTLDAQNTDYLTDTLLPWLIRWEQELNRKLFSDDPDHFCEHLVEGLLRGDQTARGDYYVKLFSIGALSINEIRELENRNPIEGEGGDRHFVPLNMTPAEFASSITGGGKPANKGAEKDADA